MFQMGLPIIIKGLILSRTFVGVYPEVERIELLFTTFASLLVTLPCMSRHPCTLAEVAREEAGSLVSVEGLGLDPLTLATLKWCEVGSTDKGH